MPGFHHHHPGSFSRRHGGPLRGAPLLVGLGFLFLLGSRGWPIFLVLLGVFLVLGALGKSSRDEPVNTPPTAPPPPVVVIQPSPPAPVQKPLPANCPRCGAPVRTEDVQWKGSRYPACAYCGSNLRSQ